MKKEGACEKSVECNGRIANNKSLEAQGNTRVCIVEARSYAI